MRIGRTIDTIMNVTYTTVFPWTRVDNSLISGSNTVTGSLLTVFRIIVSSFRHKAVLRMFLSLLCNPWSNSWATLFTLGTLPSDLLRVKFSNLKKAFVVTRSSTQKMRKCLPLLHGNFFLMSRFPLGMYGVRFGGYIINIITNQWFF